MQESIVCKMNLFNGNQKEGPHWSRNGSPLGGHAADTTNHRMELQAAIEGLKAAGEGVAITMVTDSEYLRKGITEWIHSWKRRGWRTAAKKPVLNQDLWRELDTLNSPDIEWRYTRGHSGDPDNERCDEIAQAFSHGDTPPLHRA